MTLTLYSKNDPKRPCQQCIMTKKYLEREGIPYVERDTYSDTEALEYLKAKGYNTVPVIETNEKTWVGFQPTHLKHYKDTYKENE